LKEKTRIVIGLLSIDKSRHEVTVGSKPVKLSPTEFALLWQLASEPGRVFRRDELLQAVWGSGIIVEDRTIDAHMSKVRRKLCPLPERPSLIETVWGIGYRLKQP
jgi:DNA-binding response OmpR family regulator